MTSSNSVHLHRGLECLPRPLSGVVLLCLIPALAAAGRTPAQSPCFPEEPTPPWSAIDIGQVQLGTSRPGDIAGLPPGDGFEICSVSDGFQALADNLRYLYQDTRADFELVARIESIRGVGLGGLMVRFDPRQTGSTYIQISAVTTAAGGIQLQSSYRPIGGDARRDPAAPPVPADLPVYLRVAREGSRLSTAYSRDGSTFTTHLEVDGESTGLDSRFQRIGMVQASLSTVNASTAVFSGLQLRQTETEFPPSIRDVQPRNSPIDGGIQVTILGARLQGATEVTLAGVPAQILESTPERLVVLAGEAPGARYGGVRVRGPMGSQILRDAFSYLGRQFVRGSFHGSGNVNIADAIAGIDYLFRGGPAPSCREAADSNGDHKLDLSDSIYLLGYLFLGRSAPPAPFPQPGISVIPYLPCGLPPPPEVDRISQDSLREGDEFMLFGKGFSPEAARNVVLVGSVRAEVLDSSDTMLHLRLNTVPRDGLATLKLAIDFSDSIGINPLGNCPSDGCSSLAMAGQVVVAPFQVTLVRSEDIQSVGTSEVDMDRKEISLRIPIQTWNPAAAHTVNAGLLLPAVQNLSQGSRFASFEFHDDVQGGSYEGWLTALAARLRHALSGGVASPELEVLADAQNQRIVLTLTNGISKLLDAHLGSSTIDVFSHPVGRCGLSKLDPVKDRRAFAWCRLAELLEPCDGLPMWEYFVPRAQVLSESDDIFPLPSPPSRWPGDKHVLYNKTAYCFVRDEALWNKCRLEDLKLLGSQVPNFPRSAIVIKTGWRTAEQLGKKADDLDKLYYYYDCEKDHHRYYLVMLHFTTKDVDDWFWVDLYVDETDGGTGGCGGSRDAPSAITGKWRNYSLCTNLTPSDQRCGNNYESECQTTNCTTCHMHHPDGKGFKDFEYGASYNKSLGTDFLFSLRFPLIPTGGCP